MVQAFYDTLDTFHRRIRIIRVSPGSVSADSWPPGLMELFPSCRACGLSILPVRVSRPGAAWREAGWKLGVGSGEYPLVPAQRVFTKSGLGRGGLRDWGSPGLKA